MSRTYNVLFLCTANSAHSMLGGTILNHMGQGAFRAYSAEMSLRKELRAIDRSEGATGETEVR